MFSNKQFMHTFLPLLSYMDLYESQPLNQMFWAHKTNGIFWDWNHFQAKQHSSSLLPICGSNKEGPSHCTSLILHRTHTYSAAPSLDPLPKTSSPILLLKKVLKCLIYLCSAPPGGHMTFRKRFIHKAQVECKHCDRFCVANI